LLFQISKARKKAREKLYDILSKFRQPLRHFVKTKEISSNTHRIVQISLYFLQNVSKKLLEKSFDKTELADAPWHNWIGENILRHGFVG